MERIGISMVANPGQQTRQIPAIKSLYLSVEDAGATCLEYFPYFYAEARIDFSDVRTGFRDTRSLSKALEIFPDHADLHWVADMIQDVDPRRAQPLLPDQVRLNPLPEFVDGAFLSRMETQCLQYLMRSFEARLYRNSVLNAYSGSGESRAEFIGRCLELFEGRMRQELDQLRDVFNRRLEQLKEKYVARDEFPGMEIPQMESRNRDIFSQYSERIASLFLRGDLRHRFTAAPMQPSQGALELEERLIGVEREAQRDIAELRDSYEDKARSLDEYILHPNLKDIHFVRSCILWMPKKAE